MKPRLERLGPVAAIVREDGYVLTMCGQPLPITEWFDRDGDLDCPPDEAGYCQAGPDAEGKAHTIDIERLQRVRFH